MLWFLWSRSSGVAVGSLDSSPYWKSRNFWRNCEHIRIIAPDVTKVVFLFTHRFEGDVLTSRFHHCSSGDGDPFACVAREVQSHPEARGVLYVQFDMVFAPCLMAQRPGRTVELLRRHLSSLDKPVHVRSPAYDIKCITYGPHKAVAEVSNHNETIGRKFGIQLVRKIRKSMDFTFSCFVLN